MSIANVSLSFGLLNVPVKVNAAARGEAISFNQLHKNCGGRIGLKTFCKACEQELVPADIEKGYEYEKDKYVTVTGEELKAIAAESSKVLEIVSVVKREEVDPLLFEASYYLEPDKGGHMGYKLLMLALEADSKVLVGKITMHQRSNIVIIRAARGVLLFHTMFYLDEVRSAPAVNLDGVQVKPDAVKLARQLLAAHEESFNHAEYSDDYRAAATELINAKVEGNAIAKPKAAAKSKEPLDIMAALSASVKAAGKKKKAA